MDARFALTYTVFAESQRGPMNQGRDPSTTQRVPIPSGTAPIMRGGVLVVIAGAQLGARIDLHDVPLVVGRASGSDFRIDHPSVSRRHCKIWHENGRFLVRDLGSTNHTFVNDHPVAQMALRDGDQVRVGETVFKFVLTGSLEERYHQVLYELATVDSLTGLLNRRKFRELLEQAVQQALNLRQPLSLAILDLDRFKSINDGLGHNAGDEVLRSVCATLRNSFRAGETGGRLGGEEFAILLPDTSLDAAVHRAEGLRQILSSARYWIEEREIAVTASIGVAALGEKINTAAALMRHADQRLLLAKARGRNRVEA